MAAQKKTKKKSTTATPTKTSSGGARKDVAAASKKSSKKLSGRKASRTTKTTGDTKRVSKASSAPARKVRAKSPAAQDVVALRRSARVSGSAEARAREALTWLSSHATKKTRDGLSRYGITAPTALGVTMADVKSLGKRLGRDHALARAIWATDVYEARLLVSFVGDPARLTSAEMDAWCAEFDNWAVCDTLCFHLFDRSELAFDRVAAWSKKKEEFVRRAAFALLACLALHGRGTTEQLARCLSLVDKASTDERHFVKKAVSWAIRSVGIRNRELHASALELARKWTTSADKTAVSLGREVTRALGSPVTLRRLAKK